MADIQEYKCPCCGGAIHFDTTAQKMKCPYCDTEFDVANLRSFDKELEKTTQEDQMRWETPGKVWQEGETEGMRVYVCKSCGGEIIGDENLGATKCPYCGNPVVLMGQFAGDLKPDLVIPFKLDKEAAKKALFEHYKGKPFLPKIFKNQNHIDEIKGIYVPFWLFDTDSHGDITYRATRIRTWSDSEYRYVETEYYALYREGDIRFESVPVDGSSQMPDAMMESIEPFHMADAVDFQTAYLAGYLADRYDVDANASIGRANERIKTSTESAFATTTGGYATVIPAGSNITLHNSEAKYALLPVWLLNTTFKGEHYLFAMNGQTGKFVGDLPVDSGRFWSKFFMFTGIFAVAAFVVQILLKIFGS